MDAPDLSEVSPPALLYVTAAHDVTQVDLEPVDKYSTRDLELLLGILSHTGNEVRKELRRRSKTTNQS